MQMSHEVFRIPLRTGSVPSALVEPRRKHVILVDEDRHSREFLRDYLSSHAFDVSPASDAATLDRLLASRHVDLFIVGLQRDGDPALRLLRDLRIRSAAPIIVTGDLDEEADTVLLLELGADDYLAKPFGLRELLARIRANIRRAERPATLGPRPDSLRYEFGGWELHMRSRRLLAPSGLSVRVTTGEFNLLTAFLQAPQQVLSRERLIHASRIHDEEVFDRSIDVVVMRLRRKLAVHMPGAVLIATERGVGYLFTLQVHLI
ncbi:winged helix-turn-helix domain-containing protein [Aureimonas glaciei]|uniref:Regulatory protein VirG n=1 Tax=Aureimonas glaciei TaxID=1776957 RepID=A0A917DCP6_9HYPH|nr:winged helix-turn-helix domain-containing protein [Aureimonas glaciei]GGD29289.1 regulatory protein VirG [Aureimonas glaciei]